MSAGSNAMVCNERAATAENNKTMITMEGQLDCTPMVRHGNKRQWWSLYCIEGRLKAIPPEPPSLARPIWRATVAERGMAPIPLVNQSAFDAHHGCCALAM